MLEHAICERCKNSCANVLSGATLSRGAAAPGELWRGKVYDVPKKREGTLRGGGGNDGESIDGDSIDSGGSGAVAVRVIVAQGHGRRKVKVDCSAEKDMMRERNCEG